MIWHDRKGLEWESLPRMLPKWESLFIFMSKKNLLGLFWSLNLPQVGSLLVDHTFFKISYVKLQFQACISWLTLILMNGFWVAWECSLVGFLDFWMHLHVVYHLHWSCSIHTWWNLTYALAILLFSLISQDHNHLKSDTRWVERLCISS